ncbi:MAG: hypothetical protein LQ347_006113 [Umbilicaria vellea]|nr:MAG: hypothetical protein LQ347_006113 [Umbilicaria vellea]
MLLIALTPDYTDGGTIAIKMAGVVLASLSSGGGELSFLGLTHYYGPFSLAAWGSGTGGAGLIGAGAYSVATTALGLGVQETLLVSALLPVFMSISFFVVLPKGQIRQRAVRPDENIAARMADQVDPMYDNEHGSNVGGEDEGLLGRAADNNIDGRPSNGAGKRWRDFWMGFEKNLGRSRSLSSTPFIRVHNLYLPSLLQILNLLLLVSHALFDFIPSVYFIFAIVFWEGLLGGLVYVNTFAEITDNVRKEDREFSLGATSVSDSGGICVAGFIGMASEVLLCDWQVNHGRDYCKRP